MRFLLKLRELLLRLYDFVKPFKDDRLNLFLFISVVLVIVYSGKLYLLSFSQREFWINLVEKQFEGAIKISSERGKILDRNGALLAASEKVISFYVRPSEIKNRDLFEKIILRDREVIEDYARKKGVSYREIQEALSIFKNISPKDIEFAYKKEFTIVRKDGKTIKVPFVWLKKGYPAPIRRPLGQLKWL